MAFLHSPHAATPAYHVVITTASLLLTTLLATFPPQSMELPVAVDRFVSVQQRCLPADLFSLPCVRDEAVLRLQEVQLLLERLTRCEDVSAGGRGSKHGLSYDYMALITSDCGQMQVVMASATAGLLAQLADCGVERLNVTPSVLQSRSVLRALHAIMRTDIGQYAAQHGGMAAGSGLGAHDIMGE